MASGLDLSRSAVFYLVIPRNGSGLCFVFAVLPKKAYGSAWSGLGWLRTSFLLVSAARKASNRCKLQIWRLAWFGMLRRAGHVVTCPSSHLVRENPSTPNILSWLQMEVSGCLAIIGQSRSELFQMVLAFPRDRRILGSFQLDNFLYPCSSPHNK